MNDKSDPLFYDAEGNLRPTEQGRIQQGGMGYLQFNTAVVWVRTWLKALGVTYTEHGDLGWVTTIRWEVSTEDGPVWLSFDLKSYGHLLYGLDGKTWDGMDVTYYPPTPETRWDMLMRRIQTMRAHPDFPRKY